MPSITLDRVSNFVLKDVSLKVEDGEIMVLLGPNGAGKTTILNVIAGLVPYEGNVLFDERCVDDLPAEKRGVGFLFQDLFLFPHMTVRENIAFGLRVKGMKEREINREVELLAESLNIGHLLDRYPSTLSGGEKQKVALARAVAPKPKVILLDEPFSNLDLRTTKHLRLEFRQVIKDMGITAMFVTHSLVEAEEMGDRIALVRDGRISFVGKPMDVLTSGDGFVWAANVFQCDSFKELGNGLSEVESGGLKLVVPLEGKPERIVIYAHEVFISKIKPPGPPVNRFKGVVKAVEDFDTYVRYHVDVEGVAIKAELPKRIAQEEAIKAGDVVFVVLKLRNLRVV